MAAPTLTVFTTMSPSPRVDVLFPSSALVAGTTTVTVLQISEDGEVVVRNADRMFASGGAFVTDYEVPLGVPVQYRAEQFNAAGVSLGFTEIASVQVNIDPSMVVVQDPLVPERAVMVEAKDDFAGDLVAERELQLYRIGSDTVALMGAMGLASNVPLHVQTKTLDDELALRRILAETQVLFRSMPGPVLIPRCLHVVIPQVRRVPMDVQWGGEWVRWPLVGDQVTRSMLSIIVPVVDYAQFNAAFASYTAFNAAYATYLAAIANPPAVA